MLETLTIADLWHVTNMVWTCAESEFRFSWMKLCSSHKHYTKPQTTVFGHFLSILFKPRQNFILRVYDTLTVPCEEFKIVSFTSLRMNIVYVSPTRSRFAVKLICCIPFGLASTASFSIPNKKLVISKASENVF